MICEIQYQAILQHLSIKQNMGELQSKPMENFQLKQLQQQYQPFSRGRLIPGDPTFLRLNSIFLKSQYSDALNTRFRTIQRYTLSNSIAQTQLQQQRALYQYRKANLPCIVQVAYYCFEKDNCECMQQGFRATIFTEHVEARLANFKITKKRQMGIGQNLQWLAPFTMDEGIFVLIGALHAYEVMSQQFTVNCPSAFSIGVNNKSQVKAWINDNWGLNIGGARKLSENYIIQQIIGLVEDRMVGQFSNILNLAANYMNFTFTGIQQLLSKYTINFQRGKQTLEQRLNRRNALQSGPSAEKIPINKIKNGSFPSQLLTPNNNSAKQYLRSELPTNTQHKPQLQMQKRGLSHESARYSANLQGSAVRNTSVTNNRNNFQSPKKVIKFTYQLFSPKQQSNNYIQTLNSSPASPIHYSIGVNQSHMRQSIPLQPLPVGRFPRESWNNGRGQKISSLVSHEMFDKSMMESIVQKKLKQNITYSVNSKSIHPPTPNLSQKRQAVNVNSNINYNFNRNLQNTIQINPFELSKQQKHQIEIQQQKLKHKSSLALQKTSQNMSISQITEQFKHLLKSQHKIDDDQKDILCDCGPFEQEKQSLIFQQIDDSSFQKQEESDEIYKKSFEEIKEEDQDISYSVDQYF